MKTQITYLLGMTMMIIFGYFHLIVPAVIGIVIAGVSSFQMLYDAYKARK